MAATHRHRRRPGGRLTWWLWLGLLVVSGCGVAAPAAGPSPTAAAPVPAGAPVPSGGRPFPLETADQTASVVGAAIAALALIVTIMGFLRFVYRNQLDPFHLALVLIFICIVAGAGFALYYAHYR